MSLATTGRCSQAPLHSALADTDLGPAGKEGRRVWQITKTERTHPNGGGKHLKILAMEGLS